MLGPGVIGCAAQLRPLAQPTAASLAAGGFGDKPIHRGVAGALARWVLKCGLQLPAELRFQPARRRRALANLLYGSFQKSPTVGHVTVYRRCTQV